LLCTYEGRFKPKRTVGLLGCWFRRESRQKETTSPQCVEFDDAENIRGKKKNELPKKL